MKRETLKLCGNAGPGTKTEFNHNSAGEVLSSWFFIMSKKNKHGLSLAGENPDDNLYVLPPKRERRKSSLASIGSNIVEEIIEGAVLQEAAMVIIIMIVVYIY